MPGMGEQSPALLAPRAAAARHAAHSLHSTMHCYAAQLEPCLAAAPVGCRNPRQPSGGAMRSLLPPLLQRGRRGEQLCRPPAPRAILHVEAQQVVQHRLPAGRKQTGTAAAADLQGPEPSAPQFPPRRPFPDPPQPPPLSSPRRPGSPFPSGLPPALAPHPAGPSPVVPAEHVDGVPVRNHGVFAAPAGGTQRRSAALAAAAAPPLRSTAPPLTGRPRIRRRAGGGASGAPSRRAQS